MSNPLDLETIKKRLAESNDNERVNLILELAQIPDRSGATLIMELLHQYAGTDMIPDNVISMLNIYSAHADVYFPDLFNYVSIPEYALGILRLYETLLRVDWLSLSKLDSHFGIIMSEYLDRKRRWSLAVDRLKLEQSNEYANLHVELSTLLSILGFFAKPEVETELSEALDLYFEATLKYSAVDSLWRLGKEVDDKYLLTLIADDGMRVFTHSRLKERGKLSLFPDQYRTPEVFAKSYLIITLSAGFDIGPDDIESPELRKVIEISVKNRQEISKYYVFRFFTDLGQWPKKEWIAGWVGPFPQRFDFLNLPEANDTWTLGDTWDSKTPEEHVIDYLRHYRNYEIE